MRRLWLVFFVTACAAPVLAPDAGATDAGPVEAGAPDAGANDAGPSVDAGAPDAGRIDAGVPFRDWARFPAVVDFTTAQPLYVVGDAHADPKRLSAVLATAGLMDAHGPTWTGGDAVLVFTGDYIDKYTDALGVLALVRTLEAQAPAAGGRVVALLGNHEAEFLADPAGAKTVDFQNELRDAGLDPAAVAAGRVPLGVELRQRPFAARINDFFLSHAGDTHGLTLAQLDEALRAGLDTQGFAAPIVADPDSLLEARLNPVWWESVDAGAYLRALGVAHVVEGHQPGSYTFADGTTRPAGTLFVHQGTWFLVDTGMSRGIDDSSGAALRVTRDGGFTRAERITSGGTVTLLWEG